MKKIIAMLAALVLALGCTAALADDVIVVATNPEYPPFEVMEGDQVVGYDFDMFDAVAKKAGFEYVVEPMEFASVVNYVTLNPNYVGLSGISITKERLLSVNFSNGYINAGLVVVIKAGSNYATTDDLKGKIIGVQTGTTSDFVAEEITGVDNVARYSTFLLAMQDLQGNKIDAVIVDKPTAIDIRTSMNDATLVVVDMGLQADWYGIAINKSNTELLDKINTALAELEAEGFFKELNAKYGLVEEAAEEAVEAAEEAVAE